MKGKIVGHINIKKKRDHIYYVDPDGAVIEKKMKRGKTYKDWIKY